MKKLRQMFRFYSSVVGWTALCIGSISAIAFIGIPAFRRAVFLKNQVTVLKTEVSALGQKAAVLRSLDEAALSQNLDTLYAAVPKDKSLPTIFTTVEALASQSNVGVSDLSLSQAGNIATQSAVAINSRETSDKNSLKFSAHISGTIDEVETFLTTAASIRRLVRVRELSLDFEDDANVTAQLTMESFYLPDGKTQIADDQPLELLSEPEERLMSKVAQFPLIFAAIPATSSSEASLPTRANPFLPF